MFIAIVIGYPLAWSVLYFIHYLDEREARKYRARRQKSPETPYDNL